MGQDTFPVEWVRRGRCHEIPGASAQRVGGNAYLIELPRTDEVRRLFRLEKLTLPALEKHTYRVGDAESWSAVGTYEGPRCVRVTVLVQDD